MAAARLHAPLPGCLNDLFPWVEATVGAGSNGKPPPANFTYKEGATAMGFYNVQQGDVPYFKTARRHLFDERQFPSVGEGGTGANHVMLGTGDAIWFSDGNGNPSDAAAQPDSRPRAARTPGLSTRSKILTRCPDTNNWYIQDGYGGGSSGKPSYGGGSYTMCADLPSPASSRLSAT